MTLSDRTGRLVFLTGSREGEEFELGISSVTIGTDPGAHVTLTEDEGISPRHSTIRYENGRWIVRDQGSRSGTYINFRRIHEQELKDGDVVEFNLAGPRASVSIPPEESAAVPGDVSGDEVPLQQEAPAAAMAEEPAAMGSGSKRTPVLVAGVVVVATALALYVAFGTGGSGEGEPQEAALLAPQEALEQAERDYLSTLLELRDVAAEDQAAAEAGVDSVRSRIEAAAGNPVSYDDLAALGQEKAASLVLIQAGYVVDGEYVSGPTGTGFAVGDGFIVTNLHVAEPHRFARTDEEKAIGCAVGRLGDGEVEFVLSGWHAGAPLHYGSTGALDTESASWSSEDGGLLVVARGVEPGSDPEPYQCEVGEDEGPPPTVERALTSAESDLAILRVRGGNLPPLDLASAAPGAGDPVAVLGFPRGSLPVENGEAAPRVSLGFVARATSVLIVEDELLPGAEGGPALDAQGRVVGISTVPFRGQIQAIHVEHILSLLDRIR